MSSSRYSLVEYACCHSYRRATSAVDEFQDVDAAQLRLVRLMPAPEDNLFVVGGDDKP